MNLMEYAIARCFKQLDVAMKERELTDKEWYLAEVTFACVQRYEAAEANREKAKAAVGK